MFVKYLGEGEFVYERKKGQYLENQRKKGNFKDKNEEAFGNVRFFLYFRVVVVDSYLGFFLSLLPTTRKGRSFACNHHHHSFNQYKKTNFKSNLFLYLASHSFIVLANKTIAIFYDVHSALVARLFHYTRSQFSNFHLPCLSIIIHYIHTLEFNEKGSKSPTTTFCSFTLPWRSLPVCIAGCRV